MIKLIFSFSFILGLIGTIGSSIMSIVALRRRNKVGVILSFFIFVIGAVACIYFFKNILRTWRFL